jgi:hypothetical protein
MRADRKVTIKIGCRDYTVSFHDMLKGSQGEVCKAFSHDYEKGWIRIKKGMSPQEKGNTILHEVLHAIFTERGLMYSTKEEEKIVMTMTNGFIDFIRDNPRYFKRILKLLK